MSVEFLGPHTFLADGAPQNGGATGTDYVLDSMCFLLDSDVVNRYLANRIVFLEAYRYLM